jgi:hypothetical protein
MDVYDKVIVPQEPLHAHKINATGVTARFSARRSKGLCSPATTGALRGIAYLAPGVAGLPEWLSPHSGKRNSPLCALCDLSEAGGEKQHLYFQYEDWGGIPTG